MYSIMYMCMLTVYSKIQCMCRCTVRCWSMYTRIYTGRLADAYMVICYSLKTRCIQCTRTCIMVCT